MEIHSSFFQPFFKPSPPSVGSGRCCIIIWSSVTPVPRHPFFWGVKSQKLVVMLPSPEDSKKKSGTTREKKGQIWWTPQPIKVKIVFFQHQATPKKNFPNSSLWIYEATCLSGIWFFYLQRWIAKLPLPKFKGSHLSGLAGQPWDCFNFFLYLFDCGEVFWRKMWLRKIRDRNPHGEKKMEKRCWAHSGQRFLAVGFGSLWVFSQSLFGNSPTPHEKWPQDETLHSNPNCWEIYQKKTDSVEPMFFALDFLHYESTIFGQLQS